jgi:hypothetical protein
MIQRLFSFRRKPAPVLAVLFPEVWAQVDALPLKVRAVLTNAAPPNMLVAGIHPMIDDGMDATYRQETGPGTPGVHSLMVSFVPNKPAWNSADQQTVDVLLTPEMALAVYQVRAQLGCGYRLACRKSWQAASRTVKV